MQLNFDKHEVTEAIEAYLRSLMPSIDDDTRVAIVITDSGASAYIGEDAPDGPAKTPVIPAKKATRRKTTIKSEPVVKTSEKVTKEPMITEVEVEVDDETQAAEELDRQMLASAEKTLGAPIEFVPGDEDDPNEEPDEDDESGDEQTVAEIMANMEGKTQPKKTRAKKSIFE